MSKKDLQRHISRLVAMIDEYDALIEETNRKAEVHRDCYHASRNFINDLAEELERNGKIPYEIERHDDEFPGLAFVTIHNDPDGPIAVNDTQPDTRPWQRDPTVFGWTNTETGQHVWDCLHYADLLEILKHQPNRVVGPSPEETP